MIGVRSGETTAAKNGGHASEIESAPRVRANAVGNAAASVVGSGIAIASDRLARRRLRLQLQPRQSRSRRVGSAPSASSSSAFSSA